MQGGAVGGKEPIPARPGLIWLGGFRGDDHTMYNGRTPGELKT